MLNEKTHIRVVVQTLLKVGKNQLPTLIILQNSKLHRDLKPKEKTKYI